MTRDHGQEVRIPRPEPKRSPGVPPQQPEPRCLIQPQGCPTPHERDLLRHAMAMDYALRHVRLLAEAAQGGAVPAADVLEALSRPYRFPLTADAEALAAYRKVYGQGDRAVAHLAGCRVCRPVGYSSDLCAGYDEAMRADLNQSWRERGGWPPWEQPRRGAHGEAPGASGG